MLGVRFCSCKLSKISTTPRRGAQFYENKHHASTRALFLQLLYTIDVDKADTLSKCRNKPPKGQGPASSLSLYSLSSLSLLFLYTIMKTKTKPTKNQKKPGKTKKTKRETKTTTKKTKKNQAKTKKTKKTKIFRPHGLRSPHGV